MREDMPKVITERARIVSIRRRPRGSMWVQDLVGGDGVEGGVQ